MLFSESCWLKRAVKAWPVLNSGILLMRVWELNYQGGPDCMPRNSDKLVPPEPNFRGSNFIVTGQPGPTPAVVTKE